MIQRFRQAHIDDIARLHCASLQGLLSELGLPVARAFYTGCARAPSAVGFVALEDENALIRGYVMGSIHPARLKYEVLRRNPLGTVAALCVGFAKRPSSLGWFLKSFRGPDEGAYDAHAAELTYLAVRSDARGRGIGKQLVDSFTQAIREAGVGSYELSVDENNQAALRFYQERGFQVIGRYREFGIAHQRLRKPVS